MNQIIANYTFNASAQTLTLPDIPSIKLERIRYIKNLTRNSYLYLFTSANTISNITGSVITFGSTTGMADSDKLAIQYDDGVAVSSQASLESIDGKLSSSLVVSSMPDSRFNQSNLSPFGDLVTAQITPSIQMDFVYGINTQTGVSTIANGGSVDTANGRLRLQTGTNSAGTGIFNSKRSIKYRTGQGVIARFTPVFNPPAANSIQIMGVGTLYDGYCFGYNGTAFGVLHRNGNIDTWAPQSSWNGDKCDGTGASGFVWNPILGNVTMIEYPYLGYGNITFWVQDSNTSKWILAHTIKYTNTSASVQLSNPNMYFYAQVLNAGNTSNLTLYCGSFAAFICGERSFISSPKWAADNNKSTVTTETAILNIKNCTTYNGVLNRSMVRLNSLSVSTSTSNTVITVRLKVGVTLGGSPSFAAKNGTTADNGNTITSGNSLVSTDTAGTTVTGGTHIFSMMLSSSGNTQLDLTPFAIFIQPGEIMTISVASTASATIGCAANWTEDI